MHLVSLRSFVEFRTDPTNFSAKSSQIGLLLGVAQSPRASHQELLSGNSPTASYWCINVDFDYQLFFCLNLSTKTKLRKNKFLTVSVSFISCLAAIDGCTNATELGTCDNIG
ncbi:unnamed protein product [Brassica oleracea]|uniref:(rape) hypothetical protein n=1 Tax=Brassica napus TaxID=3708 RepID=A0A816L448_BRANA|nr:unnamed protein product [Brassica napus]